MAQNIEELINNIKIEIIKVGNTLLLSNKILLDATKKCDKDKFTQAKVALKQINTQLDLIDNDIIKILALHKPVNQNLRSLIAYLKITNDLSRTSYSTKSFIQKFATVCDNLNIEVINEYATPMQNATIKALEIVISMLNVEDRDEIDELYDGVVIEEDKSDDIYALVEKNLIAEAKESNDTHTYHQMLRALRKSGKIASRCASIANLLVYARVGGNLHQ